MPLNRVQPPIHHDRRARSAEIVTCPQQIAALAAVRIPIFWQTACFGGPVHVRTTPVGPISGLQAAAGEKYERQERQRRARQVHSVSVS